MVTAALERLKKTSALHTDAGPEPGFWLSESDYRDMQTVISAYMADAKFTAIICAIVEHHDAHPDHGLACACMDTYIQQLRALTKIPHAQQRVDYVLRKVLDR